MQHSPFNLLLSRIDWSVFATLTFRGDEPSESRLMRECQQWHGWAAYVNHEQARRIFWVARVERGERGGRLHLHSLVRLRPEIAFRYFVPGRGLLPVAAEMWRHGLSRFRLVDRVGDSALPYMLDDVDGGGVHEDTKTARGRQLILSESLQGMIAMGDRGSKWRWRFRDKGTGTRIVSGVFKSV